MKNHDNQIIDGVSGKATERNCKDRLLRIELKANEILIKRGMTQTQLAKEMGLFPSVISGIITGTRQGRPTKLRIANHLGIPIEEMFPEEADTER